jgi:hypothetical protein
MAALKLNEQAKTFTDIEQVLNEKKAFILP